MPNKCRTFAITVASPTAVSATVTAIAPNADAIASRSDNLVRKNPAGW
jgi:hypothetical protein